MISSAPRAPAGSRARPSLTEAGKSRRYHRQAMLAIVFGTIGLMGLAVALLWVIGLPAGEEVEELAGLVTANWDEVETRIDGR